MLTRNTRSRRSGSSMPRARMRNTELSAVSSQNKKSVMRSPANVAPMAAPAYTSVATCSSERFTWNAYRQHRNAAMWKMTPNTRLSASTRTSSSV